jgi:hypothetical protein
MTAADDEFRRYLDEWENSRETPSDQPKDELSKRAKELSASVDQTVKDDEMTRAEPPILYFGSVDEFVREFFGRVFRRAPESELVWCAQWWKHAEAILRLEWLWRSWEDMRLDPAQGMSNWLNHHADPHLRVLMDPVGGPFAHCAHGHQELDPLPYEPPPAGLFPDVRNDDSWWAAGDPFHLEQEQ